MSLNAATIEILIAKGLSASDILDVARASECKADRTNAERQARHRTKRKSNAVTVTPPPPNEYISNPPANPGDANASPSPFGLKFVEDWNAGPGAVGARKALKLDAARTKLLKARIRDHGEEAVLTAIANLGRSKFHCGENDRSWRANIGWLLKAENFLKVLEMREEPTSAAAPVSMDDYRAAAERLKAKGFSSGDDRRPELPPLPLGQGPRSFGHLAAGIAGTA